MRNVDDREEQDFSRKCSARKDFMLVKSSNLIFLVLSQKDRVKCGGSWGGGGMSRGSIPKPTYQI